MPNEKSITEKIAKEINGRARLRFLAGERKDDVAPLDKEVYFIGRSETNNLPLSDRTASRKHAVINFIDGKFVISDLNSFKGIEINKQKVKESELKTGDKLKIGNTLLLFEIEGEPLPEGVEPLSVKSSGTLLKILAILAICALIAFAVIKIMSPSKPAIEKKDNDIEYLYSRGVQEYNVNKDRGAAVEYWKKVIELDPEGKTVQSRNAQALISKFSKE